jgi:hypothetical protein
MMLEFLGAYGLWIVLAAIMIGMHWFGMGCCARRPRHEAGEAKRAARGAAGKGSKL